MTQITIPTFDEVQELLQLGATTVGESFREIDAEWLPIMVLMAPNGALSPPFSLAEPFARAHTKGFFFANLPELIWDLDARMIGLVLPAWISVLTPNADGSIPDAMDRPIPSEDPMREERVFITLAERGRLEVSSAPIIRTQVGPRLGAWESEEVGSLGLIPEALAEAFA